MTDTKIGLHSQLVEVQSAYIDTRATLLQAIRTMNAHNANVVASLKCGRPDEARVMAEYVLRYGELVYSQYMRRIQEQLEGKAHG